MQKHLQNVRVSPKKMMKYIQQLVSKAASKGNEIRKEQKDVYTRSPLRRRAVIRKPALIEIPNFGEKNYTLAK